MLASSVDEPSVSGAAVDAERDACCHAVFVDVDVADLARPRLILFCEEAIACCVDAVDAVLGPLGAVFSDGRLRLGCGARGDEQAECDHNQQSSFHDHFSFKFGHFGTNRTMSIIAYLFLFVNIVFKL